ncbi:hypothetical protein [Flavobacterium sp. HNIBRBA15423]|uniref:hypothetical protein n=1 Tax=Flavobacterium sp. HNIBRBA15423 TaxID=3458683 RepID=UPI00404472A4
MKKVVLLMFFSILYSCQSVKVKDTTYSISKSTTELGALGEATSLAGLKNEFQITAYPELTEKIKVQIAIVPFTKKINTITLAKAKYNQKQTAVTYIDSLPIKPEVVSIKIADINQLISELNSDKNTQIKNLIQNSERTSIITSVLAHLSSAEIEKIRQADTYYLVQTDDANYQIALYNQGKKTGLVAILANTILGYEVSSFCWTETNRGKWQIGDIVTKGTSCKGVTYKRIKEKKEKSLYKM